jgi:hypothetical protein
MGQRMGANSMLSNHTMTLMAVVNVVIYLSDKYNHTKECKASRRMLALAGVRDSPPSTC